MLSVAQMREKGLEALSVRQKPSVLLCRSGTLADKATRAACFAGIPRRERPGAPAPPTDDCLPPQFASFFSQTAPASALLGVAC